MVLNHEVFSAEVFGKIDSVYQWNQSLCQYSQEPERNASSNLHQVYSDAYVFYDDVDVPRKSMRMEENHDLCSNTGLDDCQITFSRAENQQVILC